ncbi:MAG: alpha/beta fold hydrolase [Acidimicrobiales bacterium]
MKSFSSFDGVEIAYDVLGDGDPVVMLHGFASDSRTNWLRPGVARAVIESGRQAVLVDARGHGESAKPRDTASYSRGAMVRDVACLLDVLGLGAVHTVGYSMGSFTAVRLAAADPRLVSVVLGGIGLSQILDGHLDGEGQIADGLEADSVESIRDSRALAFRRFSDATGSDRLALAAVQRAGDLLPAVDDLAKIAVPVLVINGVADTLAGSPQDLAAAIAGARWQSVPGDHLSAVVKPEFRRAVVSFLDGLPVTARSQGPAC